MPPGWPPDCGMTPRRSTFGVFFACHKSAVFSHALWEAFFAILVPNLFTGESPGSNPEHHFFDPFFDLDSGVDFGWIFHHLGAVSLFTGLVTCTHAFTRLEPRLAALVPGEGMLRASRVRAIRRCTGCGSTSTCRARSAWDRFSRSTSRTAGSRRESGTLFRVVVVSFVHPVFYTPKNQTCRPDPRGARSAN